MIDGIQWKYLGVILLLTGLGIAFTITSRMKERKEKNLLKDNIMVEYKSHPEMNSQDLYKFLHQAAMGSEHAVKDSNMAKEWMKNEIAGLDLSIENKLIDTLAGKGNVIRVNLRPYIKNGYNTDKLVKAFIQTANNFKGDKKTLEEYISIAKKMINENDITIDAGEFNDLVKEMKAKEFPAVHHSKRYEELYKPAYRVIAAEYLQDLLRK